MSLSCSCNFDIDFDFYYKTDEEYAPLNTKRGRRCDSCKKLIKVKETAMLFSIYRDSINDIEERIYGNEYPLADKYMCEQCADLYVTLSSLGFCITLGRNMRDEVAEYNEIKKQFKVRPLK